MFKQFIRVFNYVFGIVLFAVVLWVLHHQLKDYRFHDVVRQVRELPSGSILIALVLTLFNYLVLTGYEVLAFDYISNPLKFWKIATASFISNAFSNNVGLSMLAGGSVRFRLYSDWGLSGTEITKVIAFYTVTFLLGLLTLVGVSFLTEPASIPALLHVPLNSVYPTGVVLLLAVFSYLLLSATGAVSLKIRDLEINLPSLRLSLFQLAISLIDWVLAASVLYVLLPPSATVSFLSFLGVFLFAQIAGLISQVPGGFGVFETAVLIFLKPTAPAASIFGALLAFRGIYYLVPLGLASALLGTYEAVEKKAGIKRFVQFFGQWVPDLAPYVLTFSTFVAGAILLFSGATPTMGTRLVWLKNFLPLPILELSHFLGSLVGLGLLFLSRGLQRRLDAAYHLTLTLLGAGIIFSLLKGFDYEEAIVLAVMFGAFLPSRKHFYRKASFIGEPFTSGWIVAIAIILLCTFWLGFFAYKHVNYSDHLWWKFTFSGDAPRFLRAAVGMISTILFFAVARLMQPARPESLTPTRTDLERARAIVEKSPSTNAHLALLGDKSFLFSENGNAFIMYGVQKRSWVVMGDPVGPKEEASELVWQFRELSDRHDGRTIFYDVKQENVHHYLDLGLTLIKAGEEAHVLLENFSLEGGAYKRLRYLYNRLEKEGCVLEVVSEKEKVITLLPELKKISDSWLETKNTKEKGFSLGFFHPEYLQHFPLALIRIEGNIVAFANMWIGAEKEEVSVDLMRYTPEAPDSVMEYLFVALMLWGKKEGYRWFDLGVAPLSGLENRPFASVWNKMGALVFRYGENFYNFQGLREYKEKFKPVWEPRYIACPGGLAIPIVLTDIAALISGGFKGIIAK